MRAGGCGLRAPARVALVETLMHRRRLPRVRGSRAVTELLREIGSVVVHADRKTVYDALLPGKGLAPDGLVASVENERVDLRAPGPDARGAHRWFLLKDEDDGTRVIHGVSATPTGFGEALAPEKLRDSLRDAIAFELALLKRKVERS